MSGPSLQQKRRAGPISRRKSAHRRGHLAGHVAQILPAPRPLPSGAQEHPRDPPSDRPAARRVSGATGSGVLTPRPARPPATRSPVIVTTRMASWRPMTVTVSRPFADPHAPRAHRAGTAPFARAQPSAYRRLDIPGRNQLQAAARSEADHAAPSAPRPDFPRRRLRSISRFSISTRLLGYCRGTDHRGRAAIAHQPPPRPVLRTIGISLATPSMRRGRSHVGHETAAWPCGNRDRRPARRSQRRTSARGGHRLLRLVIEQADRPPPGDGEQPLHQVARVRRSLVVDTVGQRCGKARPRRPRTSPGCGARSPRSRPRPPGRG